jgi:tetratricopeptide (TPR) repeat protein
MVGRIDEASDMERRAADLDPLNAETWSALAATQYFSGQLDVAAANSKRALDLNPDVWPGHLQLSMIQIAQGHYQDALQESEQVGYESLRSLIHSIAYHALGREKDSDAALSEIISKPGQEMNVALVYAFREQLDAAFDSLDKAYAHHNSGLIEIKAEPLLKNLHHDPRYTALLKKLNFPN